MDWKCSKTRGDKKNACIISVVRPKMVIWKMLISVFTVPCEKTVMKGVILQT
jgi:hypothetical protein